MIFILARHACYTNHCISDLNILPRRPWVGRRSGDWQRPVEDYCCGFCQRVAGGGVSGRVLRVCCRVDQVSGVRDVASRQGQPERSRGRTAWDGGSACGACQPWCRASVTRCFVLTGVTELVDCRIM